MIDPEGFKKPSRRSSSAQCKTMKREQDASNSNGSEVASVSSRRASYLSSVPNLNLRPISSVPMQSFPSSPFFETLKAFLHAGTFLLSCSLDAQFCSPAHPLLQG
ncbi:hypothetical protein Q3G72_010933 [Acer saccharum]|nr:hypothetical protein Q3G72_010933 [Acer saccharum]